MTDKQHYRPDIDGLRAIAVLVVIFFHAGFASFSGGFVGVDVFFVISGYLITGNIIRQINEGNFSFAEFYIRRARRLFPAMFVTIIISFVGAFLLFSPKLFADFGLSAVFAAVSASNIYFWLDSGYFDASAQLKPLLHTWSLGVEEQFYLVWPLLLLLFTHWKRPFALIIALGAIGLVATAYGAQEYPEAVFFLMPFRIFEFAIGGALTFVVNRVRLPNLISEILLVLGLGLILFSSLMFSETTNFMLSTLIPSIGTFLAILCGQARYAGLWLRNPASVSIGRISYSTYLMHWPITVFTAYALNRDLVFADKITLTIASILAGTVLFGLVEQPFRYGGRRPLPKVRYGIAYAALVGVLVAVASGPYLGRGWIWRLDPVAASTLADGGVAIQGASTGPWDCGDLCEFGDKESNRLVLVIGDSHANHYTKALDELGEGLKFRIIQSPQCFVGKNLRFSFKEPYESACLKVREEANKWMADPRVVAVIHSERWMTYGRMVDATTNDRIPFKSTEELYNGLIRDVYQMYDGFNKPVVVVGISPISSTDCLQRPKYLPISCDETAKPNYTIFAKAAQTIERPANISVVLPVDFLCDDLRCKSFSRNGEPLYSDSNHMSLAGARLIAPTILSSIHLVAENQ